MRFLQNDYYTYLRQVQPNTYFVYVTNFCLRRFVFKIIKNNIKLMNMMPMCFFLYYLQRQVSLQKNISASRITCKYVEKQISSKLKTATYFCRLAKC